MVQNACRIAIVSENKEALAAFKYVVTWMEYNFLSICKAAPLTTFEPYHSTAAQQ